jgi:hypothetical protein
MKTLELQMKSVVLECIQETGAEAPNEQNKRSHFFLKFITDTKQNAAKYVCATSPFLLIEHILFFESIIAA